MRTSLALLPLVVGLGCSQGPFFVGHPNPEGVNGAADMAPATHGDLGPATQGDLGPATGADLAPAAPLDMGPTQLDLSHSCQGVVCAPINGCHAAGTCDPATGQCSVPALADGSSCSVTSGTGSCQAGNCTVIACDSGRADCNSDVNDGCEVDLSSDAANCNSCGNACGSGNSCASGQCVPSWCTSVPGSVDQSQLQCPGWNVGLLLTQQPIGQTFVAGASGQLTGVEVNVGRCGQTDPTATVQLVVADEFGTALATASVPLSQLGDHCGAPLDPTLLTGTFFELTSSCVAVTAGQSLSLSLTIENATPDSCDSNTHTCVVGGGHCHGDYDCELDLRVSVSDDQYAAGTLTVRGVPDSGDMTFKTFVR
ncbi:MAG: hypothetical protein JWN44_3182 [Myxococcales bacterium]|nr:hypothetical protein [Myxococcales bacterium]